MIQHVNAIYEQGVLKPLGPLELHDQERVSLSIEKISESETDANDDGPTLFELLDEAGLIGCIKDAPPDLSTNPKYMDGFGQSAK
jgi:predicted DNA-binding antitoxin AbrB/MazE fold protein